MVDMTLRTVRAALVVAIAAVTLSACSTSGDESEAVPPAFDGAHVSAADFSAAVDGEGVTVIDVRTPAEFADGHLPGAVNINVEGADFAAQVEALDPAGEYAVYCRSGNRSRVAIDWMADLGVASTVGLEGGIGAWTGDLER